MEIKDLYKLYINCDYKVCTDSRNIVGGSMFFALKGENFDANKFALEAIGKGAKYAVVDDVSLTNESYCIYVEDTLKCLQDLANFHRRCLKIPFIGIGGSNGKTTTKELIQSVLSRQFKTYSTPGNFNNHIGVPLTILGIHPETEIAVIELGANRIGDVEELCLICEPDMGLITNIGKEHLEGFGSLEGVAKAESELYHYLLKNNGLAFVNQDDEWLMRMSRSLNKWTYSAKKTDSKTYGKLIHDFPDITFSYHDLNICSKLSGSYNFENILAAVSFAEYFKIKPNLIKEGIEAYIPSNKRSQILTKGSTLFFLDAYNANPSSMEKALQNFSRFKYKKKIIILGDMFEMGDHSEKEHDLIYRFACELQTDELLVAGEHFNNQAIRKGGKHFKDAIEINTYLKKLDLSDTAIFIKGSRGMKMENALAGLTE